MPRYALRKDDQCEGYEVFFVVDEAGLLNMPTLRSSMFADRASQFVDRHGWPLRLDEHGLEMDEYDDELATYCALAVEGRHRASVRLRPAVVNSMIEDHFPDLWREDLRQSVEITRFCASPTTDAASRSVEVPELLLGLCRHCQRADVRSIFGVVFPSVAKVIRQSGWAGDALAELQNADGKLLLMQWVPTSLVAWTIQEKLERREAVLDRMSATRLAA